MLRRFLPLLLLLATPVAASEPGDGFAATMTGDWGGLRQWLVDTGITPAANYLADVMTNPVGGERQGWAYAQYVGASLTFDFGKLVGLDGLSLFAQGNWSHGQNLSAEDIGNLFPVGHAYTGSQVALAQLYLQQTLIDDAVTLALGRLTPNQTFAFMPIFANYLNSAVNLSPFALYANDFGFFGPPGAQWGATAFVRFADGWHAGIGAYLPDETASVAGDNGLQFRFQPKDGVMTVAEVGYAQATPPGGLSPLQVKAGGLYDTRSFDRLGQPGETIDDNYALYLSGQWTVYHEAESDTAGLTPWINVVYAPKERASQLPVFLSAGAVYQGLLPGRSGDRTAIGVFYGQFSRHLSGQSAETVVEASYTVQVTPWLSLVPDFQYIFSPSGRSDIDSAAVFGGEIAVTF